MDIIVFQGGDDERGYRNMCKIPRGSNAQLERGGLIYYRYKFVTVSLPKRPLNGRFTSETAVRRFQNLNHHLDPEVF